MKNLRKENMELRRSLEFLQNYMQELKSEVAQIKNMNKNNYSQSAFDGAVERIRIFEASKFSSQIYSNYLSSETWKLQADQFTEINKLVNMTNLVNILSVSDPT